MAKKKQNKFRSFINDIHLWMGLGSGIIIFLICLTGTILAFEHEIKAAFTEDVKVMPAGDALGVDELITSVKTSMEGELTNITIPHEKSVPYEFTIKKDPSERRGSKILVNPYTSEIAFPQKSAADGFMFTMFKLHRWLLMDSKIGRPIVGVATIIFLLLSLSGIILWFPKKMKWSQLKHGFRIKTDGNWKRINHDLHNTLGFYACLLIIIMGITGLCWSFETYRTGLGNLIGTKVFNRSSPSFNNKTTPASKEITLSQAIALANSTLPYPGKIQVSMPSQQNNYYSVRKYRAQNWSPVTYDALYMDRTGAIIKVEKFSDKPLNVQFASLIKPIHTGEIFGLFSKVLYFIACLIATSLPVTGTLIWWNKLKKKRNKSAKKKVLV